MQAIRADFVSSVFVLTFNSIDCSGVLRKSAEVTIDGCCDAAAAEALFGMGDVEGIVLDVIEDCKVWRMGIA